jgi:hypothetical protein
MAYQYDEFGNVIGEYESEEERRAKELADTAVETQEIKTYGDGTVEQVTKRSLSPELQQAQAAYQQTVAPVAAPVTGPVSPEQMAYTRQQESGGRRDIGYHFQPDAQGKRQSSAFGPYGITEAAYKDIAKQDPSLAKPITEWTQEEHDRGYTTLVGRNQKRLTQLGVEPTGGALQLSHLLGPDGAAKFLKTGQVSEAAAAANGGAERLKQIASGRFAGGASASSGAAKQPQAQAQIAQPVGPVSPEQVDQQAQILTQQLQQLAESQKQTPPPNSFDEFGTPVFSPQQANLDMHLNNYQGVQDSPDQLLNLSKDPTLPDWLKERSRNRAADLIIEQRQDAKAQKEVADLDENKIARLLRERKGEGSRMKGMLYAAFGLTDLANEEKYKLGIGTDKSDMIGDQPVIVKVAANGKAIDGINTNTGKELTAKEIAMYNAGTVAPGSKLNLVGGTYVNDTTGEVGTVVRDEKTGKSWVQTDEGKKPLKGFRPQTGTGTAADQRAKLIQEMNIKLQGKAGEEAMAIQRDYNKLLVGQGLAPMQPGDTPVRAPQIAGGPATSAGQAVAGQPVQGGTAVQGQAVGAGQAVQGAGAGAGGARPTASQIAATAEQQKQEAQEVGMDIGKIRVNFGKSKDAATRLINQAEDLITDKGFSVSVGASAQPFFQYIPGSDRATWSAKHEEVVGQTFVEAIKELKGMGALSDREGAAASAALSRIKNTNQNEESFKAAVRELQFIVKRGVDRNAEKLNKEKPFGTNEPNVNSESGSAGTTSSGNKYKKVQ